MAGYIKETLEIAGKTITFETGRLAKQADGAVLVGCGDTLVLCTVVASKQAREGQSFFPLTVEYREKFYAAGKIPGGFFKREGRLRESEILTCRLIDRPIRPLFPEGYLNEVQVILTVISHDRENAPDILALLGTSAALEISDVPFSGPVGGVRIGRVEGSFVVNPLVPEKEFSDMDIVVAGTEDAVTMIEGEAKEITEEDAAAAIEFAHGEIKKIAAFLKKFREKAGRPKREVVLKTIDPEIKKKTEALAKGKIEDAFKISDKIKRQDAIADAKKEASEAIEKELGDEAFKKASSDVGSVLEEIESGIIRDRIANESVRPDGRKFDEIRPIECEITVLPRTHGSGLFTRGQTQALVVVTLGSDDDAQILDEVEGEFSKTYMLQYNFPPFSTGEAKPLRGVGRREVGHGNLAERSLRPVMPSREDFPYTVQVVSDILESNGSSSMASVCGATLALMDAGVPITKPVAGIAMGLIKEGDKFIILTDIQGAEDHFGDMDFKVAGTKDGITAIQMDIKISGVTREIMAKALSEAKKARLFILEEKIVKCIAEPKKEMSPFAPKVSVVTISKERIKDLIGPGGKNIKRIVEETGAKIDIEQDGSVRIFANDDSISQMAIRMIKEVTAEAEVGAVYEGEVVKLMPFGAFVNIMPGTDGLVHISAIRKERVEKVEDVLKEGQRVKVLVKEVDRKTGKISLTMKDVEQPEN
ncbi:MAG TPA: polyribonucleotide nucleotidyltransferase [bacterium]|nr:polyribonucleotide nucleotidyltransferase [bacterium]